MNNLGKEILKRISNVVNLDEELFVVDYVSDDPFEKLVAIILSQNTSDKNAIKALNNLKEKVGLSRKAILEADLRVVEEALIPGGLYKEKAKRLKLIAEKVSEDDLQRILSLPVEDARRELLNLPGVGKKTADVFLAIYGKRTIGVDTHAARVAKRLGIVDSEAKYEDIRKALVEVFDFVDNYDIVHRYLIALGRKWCKSRRPKCESCPVSSLCKYHSKSSQRIH
ncbi:MAG: endonuclease III domain-containing protein [Candidatus Njordarchaeales archaeon]